MGIDMEKVILEYNKETGSFFDRNGALIGTYLGAVPFDNQTDVDALVKLKNAGFSADEIIELKRKEVI